MSTKYKLTYFNVTGLGEPIRYLLSYLKADFEDVRIEFADWEQLKSKTEFGQLPLLEFDGLVVNQSGAICRHLAKKAGIAGKSDVDQMQADAIVDTITDWRLNYTAWFREQDPVLKEKKLEEIKKTHNPFYLGKFEELVKKNNGNLVNGQLTWADVYFAAIADMLTNVQKGQDILANTPNLAALKKKVDELPGIKEYRSKRPETSL